jgi:hypothetical protein
MKTSYIVSVQSNPFAEHVRKIYWGILRYIVYAYWGVAVFLNLIMLSQALTSAGLASDTVLENIIAMSFVVFFAPFEGIWSLVTSSAYSINNSGLLPLIGAVSTWVIIIDSIQWIYKKTAGTKEGEPHRELKMYIKSKMKILIGIYILLTLVNLVFQNFEGILVYSIFYIFLLSLGLPILVLAYHIKYPEEVIIEKVDVPENNVRDIL